MPRRSGRYSRIVVGDKALVRELKRLPRAVLRNVLPAALKAGAELLRDAIQERAPVETGLLRSAIKVQAAVERHGVLVISVGVGEGDFKGAVYYAAMVEYGTSHAPAHPFLGPAVLEDGPKAVALVTALIYKGIEAEANL